MEVLKRIDERLFLTNVHTIQIRKATKIRRLLWRENTVFHRKNFEYLGGATVNQDNGVLNRTDKRFVRD